MPNNGGVQAVVFTGAGAAILGSGVYYLYKWFTSAVRLEALELVAVTSLHPLKVGQIISYKAGVRSRHAVIVSDIQPMDDSRTLKVIRRGDSGRVIREMISQETIKLVSPLTANLKCYDPETVAARARSLCALENPTETQSEIDYFSSFFQNDKHFAVWCQTGLEDSVSTMSPNVEVTNIENVQSLSRGDHVRYQVKWRYEHGIVTRISPDFGSVALVRFHNGSVDEIKLSVDVKGCEIPVSTSRFEYDFAVCRNSDPALIAEREKQTQTLDAYKTNEEFAIWCKTRMATSAKKIYEIANSRIRGRVRIAIETIDMLKVGDHIMYCSDRKTQIHGIVMGLNDNSRLEVCFADFGSGSIKKISEDVAKKINYGELWKYFYDVNDSDGEDEVLDRANKYISTPVSLSKLPFKHMEHFATWCKSGKMNI
jgi:hypothetical protein